MKKIILLFSVLIFLFSNSFFMKPSELFYDTRLDQFCHFGINNPYPFSSNYDMTLLGADSYINWSVNPESLEPQNYEQIKVIRTWGGTNYGLDPTYPNTLANLPAQLAAFPEAIWIVGNEPDTTYETQDNLVPELYAQRFLEISAIIRANDPTALIGFAPIVQPSPARIYYLERVVAEMNRLLDGTETQISDTFDLWTIHSFLLNEVDYDWGTGLPTGVLLEELGDNPPLILDYRYDTHSIVLFSELIINFRQWIYDQGLGDKPLWITEYGSLMPTYIVPESETIEYMIDTFDFLLSSKNPVSGYALDDNRLVQKWFWYSLNESIDTFGGTLFDRELSQETNIGLNFRQYQTDLNFIDEKAPDFLPVAIESISPIHYSPDGILVDYLVTIRVRNNISADHNSNFLVSMFDSDDVLLGTASGSTMRCAGDGFGTLIVSGIAPGSELFDLKISVESADLPDINPENNTLIIKPELLFLPALIK